MSVTLDETNVPCFFSAEKENVVVSNAANLRASWFPTVSKWRITSSFDEFNQIIG